MVCGGGGGGGGGVNRKDPEVALNGMTWNQQPLAFRSTNKHIVVEFTMQIVGFVVRIFLF